MSWKKCTLADIITVKKGSYITKKEAVLGKYPVILGGKEPAYYIDKYNHTGKAIVISRSGASAGYVSFWNEPIFITDGFLIEPTQSTSHEFLFYLLKNKQAELSGKQRGSAIPHVTPDLIKSISVMLPDLPTQRRIASILSAYDNLIENNRRQIKLLEEAAQRLYREWFVELRFPGHEGVKVVDGVPEGWKKVTIADSLAFHIGGGWGKETTNGKNTVAGKVIRGTDINDIKNGDFGSIPLRYHTENDILKRVLHPNDIVFELSNGNINNIGRCLMIDNTLLKNLGCNTICASFCKLLRPHDEMISHLLYWEIQDMQNSGRMLPLKKHGSNGINNFDFDGFLKHEYLLPLEKRFVQPLIYIMQKISNIQSQLVFLQEARDRLLSKLMSGEMEV